MSRYTFSKLFISASVTFILSASAHAEETALEATGTAFAIAKNGYLATNAHVVKNAERLVVVNTNGVKADAQVVAIDPANDLAIIKADLLTVPLYLESDYRVKKGAEVATMGFPNPSVQGNESKFTTGVISAESGLRNDIRFLQISVPVQPGNSGGALINNRGAVVGIITSKLNALRVMAQTGDVPQNVNYAVKIKYLLAMTDGLQKLRDEMATLPPKGIRGNEDVARLADNATYFVMAYAKSSTTTHGSLQATPPSVPDGQSIVARVNGRTIPIAHFNILLNTLISQGQSDTPKLRGLIKEELVNRLILVQEAERLGLAGGGPLDNPREEVTRQINAVKSLIQYHYSKHPITESAIQAEYDNYKATVGDTEYHARHILVSTKQDALNAIARLKNGEGFENIAHISQDSDSVQKGGDLGWASPATFVKPFADGLIALRPGTFTDSPIETKFGFHVIKLEETRRTQFPSFNEVRDKIKESLVQKQLTSFQKRLREESTIQ